MRSLVRTLCVCLLALALTSCSTPNTDAAEGISELEVSYLEVPPEQTEALGGAVNGLLAARGAGTVTVVGPGQLLLLAPGRTREQIESSLAELLAAHRESQPQTDPDHRVRLQTWMLKAGDGLGKLPPAPAELKEALAGLPYSDWRQLEASVQSRTTDGNISITSGATFSARSRVFRQPNGYLNELSLVSVGAGDEAGTSSHSPLNAEARLLMRPGEYVLLSFRDEGQAGQALVVRIEPIDAEPAQ